MDAVFALEPAGFFQDLTFIDFAMALVNVVIGLIILPWLLWGLWLAWPYCMLVAGIVALAVGLLVADRETRLPYLCAGGAMVALGGTWIARHRRLRGSAERRREAGSYRGDNGRSNWR